VAQSLSRVKIGNMRSSEFADIRDRGGRTEEAHRAVLEWHKDNPSAWWMGNPFDLPADTKYRGGFNHAYFDTEGTMRSVWVTYKGRLKPLDPTPGYIGRFKRETDAVLAVHGAFNGN
jgi:hypothetical protein